MPVNKTFLKKSSKKTEIQFINSSDLSATPGSILQNQKESPLHLNLEPKIKEKTSKIVSVPKAAESARNMQSPKLSYDFSVKKKSLKSGNQNKIQILKSRKVPMPTVLQPLMHNS